MTIAIHALTNAVVLDSAAKQHAKTVVKYFYVVDKAKSCDDMFDSDFSYDGKVTEMAGHLQSMSKAAIQSMGDLASWLADIKHNIAGFQHQGTSSVFNVIAAPEIWDKLRIAGT